jgi:hypothetical protein
VAGRWRCPHLWRRQGSGVVISGRARRCHTQTDHQARIIRPCDRQGKIALAAILIIITKGIIRVVVWVWVAVSYAVTVLVLVVSASRARSARPTTQCRAHH